MKGMDMNKQLLIFELFRTLKATLIVVFKNRKIKFEGKYLNHNL